MDEWEALIQRRQMLWDRISKMHNEIERINLRLDFLERRAFSMQFDPNYNQEPGCLPCFKAQGFEWNGHLDLPSSLGDSRLHGHPNRPDYSRA